MKMVSKDDRSVLEQTRSAWEAAFHRQPFYSGASFGMLADRADEHHDTARTALTA
jgi:hypothetical protein